MFKFTKDNISILTILDKRRPKQSGLYPIKVQVVYRKTQKYYNTGKDLSVDNWERLPSARDKELKEIRESVENSFSLVKQNVEALAERGGFSFDALNLRLGKASGDTLNNALKAKIEALRKNEQIGTMDTYISTLKNIEKFAGQNIAFEDVTVQWLKKCEQFWSQDKGLTTIGIYLRNIRTMMNEALTAGVIKETQYPFGKNRYEIKESQGRKKALTIEQIKEIIKYEDGLESSEKYRDLWLFIFLCNGMNVADMIRLKYSDIENSEICFVRQKTARTTKIQKEIRIAITPQLQVIIDKWGTSRKNPNDYIFPFLKGSEDAARRSIITKDITRRINRHMNRIGETLGLGGITTYTARHSYATVLKRSGANIAYISESLGHNDLKTTEHYLASFEKDERIKNANILLQAFDILTDSPTPSEQSE